MCHRGIKEYYPENTTGSILDTNNNIKYDGVEFDIRLTKDNQWILYHDDDLLRLNGINKKVNEIEYSITTDGEGKCIICMDDERQYACIPCGHLVVCEQCKHKLDINKICPICASSYSAIIKIYK